MVIKQKVDKLMVFVGMVVCVYVCIKKNMLTVDLRGNHVLEEHQCKKKSPEATAIFCSFLYMCFSPLSTPQLKHAGLKSFAVGIWF